MNNDTFIKLGYDIIFYNTIGLIDDVVIRMVRDLLCINVEYKNVNVIRNEFRYGNSCLVICFDNSLFIDIRFNYDNRFGMKDKNMFDSINSFLTIFDNTYDLKEDEYRYVMLDLTKFDNNLLCDEVLFESVNDKEKHSIDNWKIVYYNCNEAYSRFKHNNIDCDKIVRWLSLLMVTSFSELDEIIRDDLLSSEERDKLFNNIRNVNCDSDIIFKVDKIIEKEEEYIYLYKNISKYSIMEYKYELVPILYDKGLSKKDISFILQLSDICVEKCIRDIR